MKVLKFLRILPTVAVVNALCEPIFEHQHSILETAAAYHRNDSCHSILINNSETVQHQIANSQWIGFVSSPSFRVKRNYGLYADFRPLTPTFAQDYKALAASLGFTTEVIFDLDGHKVPKYYKVLPTPTPIYLADAERNCGKDSGVLPHGIFTLNGFIHLATELGLTGTVPFGLKKLKRLDVSTSHHQLKWTNGKVFGIGTVTQWQEMFEDCMFTPPSLLYHGHYQTLYLNGKQF